MVRLLKGVVVLCLLLALVLPVVFAADEQFKPYLHKANIPRHPKVQPYGTYQTNLFPGAATYSYPLDVPKGTNNLQPSLSLSYNSQQMKGLPNIVGSGWSLTANYVYRDVNATLNTTADDEFHLVFNGNDQQLAYHSGDGFWRTEIDSFVRVQRPTGGNGNTYNQYWLATEKDGTQYRFGYTGNSELVTTTNNAYAVKWYLDLVTDTFGNNVTYSYLENPFSNDLSATYPDSITYNRDNHRQVYFMYENFTRPDGRLVYDNGNRFNMTRRLSNIHLYANGGLVRRYSLNYQTLTSTVSPISTISNISFFGADNVSKLHTVFFSYRQQETGYQNYTGQWIAPELFTDLNESDRGVRLADLNSDGFIDLIQGRQSTSQKRAWINAKNGNWVEDASWAPPIYVVDQRSNDTGVFFVDLDADGKVDILQSGDNEANTVKSAWLNNGSGWTNATDTWRSPVYFVANANSKGAEVVDLNGDSRPDIFLRNVDDNYVYLNNGSGWIDANATWKAPTEMSISGGDRGVRLVDLNGDGLVDYVQSTSRAPEIKQVWLNNQSGWANATPLWDIPAYFADTERSDTGVRFFDMNGDGLSDMVHEWLNGSQMNQSAWLNTGFNWTQNNTWKSPTAFTFNGRNLGRRIGDVNGDGLPDIIISYEDASGVSKFTNVKGGTAPYVLQGIRTEYGGNITITYNLSTTKNNNGEDSISDLGFAMWIVNSVTQNNSLSNAFHVASITTYNYTGGSYDYGDGEFRGFKQVNELRPDNATVRHFFRQDEGRKGKEYRTEIVNTSGDVFSITNNTFSNTFSNGRFTVFLINESVALHDGLATGPKVTNVSYSYDTNGNLIRKINYGDQALTGDEKQETYEYVTNTSDWILNKVSRSRLLASDGRTIVRETEFFYDNQTSGTPTRGALTRQEQWLNGSAINPTTTFTYDQFGNVRTQTDPLGRVATYRYDNTSTYVSIVTNPLDQQRLYEYDLGTGNLLSEEWNHIRTLYTYDTFSRPAKEIRPYDNSIFPTKQYTYSFDGTAPESIKISSRESSNKTSDVYFFYDGLGNLIQIKSPAENDQQVVKNLYYDQSNRIHEEDNPYFDTFFTSIATPSTVINSTRYSYDPLDRITLVTNPDTSKKKIVFDHWLITDYNENSNPTDYQLDAHGQIIRVQEYNNDPLLGINQTYNTSYAYDTSSNLVGIKDHLGNNYNFTYDTLGRKTILDDPDLGHWQYGYDLIGNLIGQNDSKGNNIALRYDEMNRIINKNTTSFKISFGYDLELFGTLSNITSTNYTFKYTYDDRLRIVKEEVLLRGKWYETGLTYDSLDRLVEKRLPGQDIDFYYDKQGKVDKMTGFISSTPRNAFGSPLSRTYNNTKATTFTYETNTNRLSQIVTDTNVQQMNYTYDKVGNVLSIDAIPATRYRMGYDYLDRLVNTTINNDVYEYTYNPTGNLLKLRSKNNTVRYTYGQLAHSPAEIITGNESVQIYDLRNITGGSKNMTFRFWIVNQMNNSLSNVPWTVDWGDGTQNTGTVTSIIDNATVTADHNYTNAGEYIVNASSNTSTGSDRQKYTVRFGVRTHDLTIFQQTLSNATVEFILKNNVREDVANVNWTCNTISSATNITVTGNTQTSILRNFSFSTPGSYPVDCITDFPQGKENKSITVTYPGLVIDSYNRTAIGPDQHRLRFTITNYWNSLDANWSITSDGQTLNGTVTLGTGVSTTIDRNITYSTDGGKLIQVNASRSGIVDQSVNETFEVDSLTVGDYRFYNKTGTTRLFEYLITNTWPSTLNTSWDFSDPTLSSSQNTSLAQNQSVFVFVEQDYTSAAVRTPLIRAFAGSFIDSLKDIFRIKLVGVEDQQTLHEGNSESVTEIRAKSYSGSPATSWTFDTGLANVSSTQGITLNNNETFIFIGSKYGSAGVYRTQTNLNTSTQTDNSTGVAST